MQLLLSSWLKPSPDFISRACNSFGIAWTLLGELGTVLLDQLVQLIHNFLSRRFVLCPLWFFPGIRLLWINTCLWLPFSWKCSWFVVRLQFKWFSASNILSDYKGKKTLCFSYKIKEDPSTSHVLWVTHHNGKRKGLKPLVWAAPWSQGIVCFGASSENIFISSSELDWFVHFGLLSWYNILSASPQQPKWTNMSSTWTAKTNDDPHFKGH